MVSSKNPGFENSSFKFEAQFLGGSVKVYVVRLFVVRQ